MRQQDMINSLLDLGVKRGVLTCQELSEAFPSEFFPLEELERFLRLLEELGVKVVDSEKSLKRKARKTHGQIK